MRPFRANEGHVAGVEMPVRPWMEETREPTKGVLLTVNNQRVRCGLLIGPANEQSVDGLCGSLQLVRFERFGGVGTPYLGCRQRLTRGTLESC